LPDAASQNASWFETIGNATKRILALTTASPLPAPTAEGAARQSLGKTVELLRRERFAEALAIVRGLPADSQKDPDVMLLRAVLLVHAGRLLEAAAVSRALMAIDELHAGANYVLALCLEAAGDDSAAAHHYRVAAYLDRDFAMPRLHLGLLARRSRDVGAAQTELEMALTLLRHEDAARLLLFGGGFAREALVAVCEAELRLCVGRS
jgi:chemotaxis protein methyltransferase CheR